MSSDKKEGSSEAPAKIDDSSPEMQQTAQEATALQTPPVDTAANTLPETSAEKPNAEPQSQPNVAVQAPPQQTGLQQTQSQPDQPTEQLQEQHSGKQAIQPPAQQEPQSQPPESEQNPTNSQTQQPAIPSQLQTTDQQAGLGDASKQPAKQEEPPAAPRREENLAEHTLQQVLKINVGQIDFGELLPGQILEENLIIMNTFSSTKVPFKIKVNCLNKEFEDLDEYVYSMRRPNNNDTYNYNDTFLILLTAKSVSYYKVAIKVPNVKEEKDILGSIDLTSNDCQGTITIPIRAKIVIPAIKCEKMITLKSLGLPVVKLYMKTPKRQDFRINLKNMCKLNLVAELFILKNEMELRNIDFIFYPQNVNLPPNMPMNFMMSAKCVGNEAEILNKEVHCVMVVKIKNSSAIFSYPIVILIGDGKPEGKVMA